MTRASIPATVLSSIAVGNVGSAGLTPSILANMALQNLIANVNLAQQAAVSNQQAMNQIQLSVLGAVTRRLTGLSPGEAAAAQRLRSRQEVQLLEILLELLRKKKP